MPRSTLIARFEALVGKENVFAGEADRQCYAYDGTMLPPVTPLLVVRPTETEQIGPIIKRCSTEGLPITVRGAGTNLSGGSIPDRPDSVVLLTNGLNKILEINREDLYAVVQPGVVTAALAQQAAAAGLFYPPDPGSLSVSTLAGNIAENAGGLRGLKYGVTKDYVLGLEFYDSEGELVKTGSRTVKCATGYNLAGLLTGSEGTLGVISRAVLKLLPPPRASRALLAVFDDLQKASEAVAGIIAAPVLPCTLEFLDRATVNYVEDDQRIGLPRDAAAILLIEVDGHPAQVEDEAAQVQNVLRGCGATEINTARDASEKDRLLAARRNALPALARARTSCLLEDATVPRSRIPAMVKALNGIASRFGVDMGIFGHAGDGNLHPTLLYDRRDREESRRVEQAVDAIFNAALELGGTLSGEHGIGTAKAKWLEKETSPGTLRFARRLRRSLDPKGLFNPSKLAGI